MFVVSWCQSVMSHIDHAVKINRIEYKLIIPHFMDIMNYCCFNDLI